MANLFPTRFEHLLCAASLIISSLTLVLTPWPTVDELLGIPNPAGAVEILRSSATAKKSALQ